MNEEHRKGERKYNKGFRPDQMASFSHHGSSRLSSVSLIVRLRLPECLRYYRNVSRSVSAQLLMTRITDEQTAQSIVVRAARSRLGSCTAAG